MFKKYKMKFILIFALVWLFYSHCLIEGKSYLIDISFKNYLAFYGSLLATTINPSTIFTTTHRTTVTTSVTSKFINFCFHMKRFEILIKNDINNLISIMLYWMLCRFVFIKRFTFLNLKHNFAYN